LKVGSTNLMLYSVLLMLQCVEHTVHFKIKEEENEGDANESHCSINARDFFVPTQVIGF